MDSNQEAFIHDNPGKVQSFLDAVNTIKPTAIIGKFIVEVRKTLINIHFFMRQKVIIMSLLAELSLK